MFNTLPAATFAKSEASEYPCYLGVLGWKSHYRTYTTITDLICSSFIHCLDMDQNERYFPPAIPIGVVQNGINYSITKMQNRFLCS